MAKDKLKQREHRGAGLRGPRRRVDWKRTSRKREKGRGKQRKADYLFLIEKKVSDHGAKLYLQMVSD